MLSALNYDSNQAHLDEIQRWHAEHRASARERGGVRNLIASLLAGVL
jgi:hypothetical protein